MSPANLNNYISEIAHKLGVYGADGIIDRAFELGLLAVVDEKAPQLEAPATIGITNELPVDDEASHSSDEDQLHRPVAWVNR